MKIAIACGGTGGHIFPGLATANVQKERGHDVTLWITGRDVEGASVDGWNGAVETVAASGFPTSVSFASVMSVFRLIKAFLTCRRRMIKQRPDVMLGMGSYASVGPVLAARSLKIPIVLHESNAVPGRAVSLLSRFADKVGIGFHSVAGLLSHADCLFTGFPLRKEMKDIEMKKEKNDVFTLLIMGGSQGAHAVNLLVMDAVKLLYKSNTQILIIHLTGMRDERVVRETYEQVGAKHEVHGFLQDMKAAYARADLVVARAGAATCAELAVCGVPALLVPLPSATHDHQTANARSLEEVGGAVCMTQKDLTPELLAEFLQECISNSAKLEAMSEAFSKIAVSDGAERLADLVEEVSGKYD